MTFRISTFVQPGKFFMDMLKIAHSTHFFLIPFTGGESIKQKYLYKLHKKISLYSEISMKT